MLAPTIEAHDLAMTEHLLSEWGRIHRQNSDYLGYPRSSSIADMVEHVKVWERQKQPKWGYFTAQGKQKRVFRKEDTDIKTPDWYMVIDREVARLPSWMVKPVKRAYLWGQPDRIAAKELRIAREQFTSAREKAVKYIAERLALGGIL